MTVDTGVSTHFLDTNLLPDITQNMTEYTKIDPPLIIDVPGKGQPHSSAMGALKVTVSDRQGTPRAIRLPFFCVPDLGRHLFSGGTAMKHGVGVLFTPKSPCLDMGSFQIPVQPDANCDTLFHFDLAITADSVATQHAFVTISGADLPRKRSDRQASSGILPSQLNPPKTPANIWHKGLGHPSVQVLEKLARADGSEVHLHDSFSACDTCHVNKCVQNNHPKTVISDNITQPLQVVSTDLIGPISLPALGGYSYISKFNDYITRLNAVYFIAYKDEALLPFVNFTQDVAIPSGLRIQRLHSDNRKEYVNSAFRNYCKTTGAVQTFTSPHTPQQNGISERDGRTILNMTRCILNEARLPKILWGEIAATSVFLINRLPHKALQGDTPYYRMFGKQAELSFLRIIGCRAFVHVEGHTNKLQPKAWEGILVGYNSDSPSFQVYNRETRRITSSRNVTFIEEPPAVIPTVDASDESVSDFEDKTASPDEYIINKGISLLEQTDTESTGTSSSNTNSSRSSPAAQDPRAGKISSRLRSSTPNDLPQPDYINPRQARALQQLNLATIDSTQDTLDSYTEYIGAVDIDSVLPPAAVDVPNTYMQAMVSPQATQWEKAMRKELDSLNDHAVADLIPFSSVLAGYSIIGTRWVYRVKTDGRFKARVVVQGWAQQHGVDCLTTFVPVCRIGSQRLLLAIAARRMSSPREGHLANIKSIFRYLRKRPNLSLVYRKDSRFELPCYSDASYASTKDYKSVTGSMVFLAGDLIYFSSRVQRIVAQSSSEGEFFTINSTAKHGVYFSSLMGELGWSQLLKFKLLTDTRSALSLFSNGTFSNRSRHISVRYEALRGWVSSSRIALDHVPSSHMLSDILTKSLVKELQDCIIRQVSLFI
ncbi:unnamed protein product [Ectocarpus sp. CCAP 1310/34]|nr:unnamed protein product [Ectocarpus sp. CCAP 1310/34]